MTRKTRGDNADQLSLFVEIEPAWIRADVDAELRGGDGARGVVANVEGERKAIDDDASDEDLEQFAQWLKQKDKGV